MTGKPAFSIGRYMVHEQVGAGSMGVVYAGFDPLICRPVAIKVIRSNFIDEREKELYRARFQHEVQSAGRCIHPGIITIYDYIERDDDRYIVMEFVEGTVLQQSLTEGSLSLERSVDIAAQLLDALGHAHRQGIVHRDIKPSNIIIGAGSRVKITDFGIARLGSGGMTHAGTLVGTPSYMAPEQARGEAVDHRADLFSVGIVLLRALTGAMPYGEGGFVTILQRVAASEPVDTSLLQQIAPDLAVVVNMALAKNPADRFQSADEFARLLQITMAARSAAGDWPWPGSATAPETPSRLISRATASQGELGSDPSDLDGGVDAGADVVPPSSDASANETSVATGDTPGGEASSSARTIRLREGRDDQLRLSDDFIDQATLLLARHIGPVSLLFVRRLIDKGGSIESLRDDLAESIDSSLDRNEFYKEFDEISHANKDRV